MTRPADAEEYARRLVRLEDALSEVLTLAPPDAMTTDERAALEYAATVVRVLRGW